MICGLSNVTPYVPASLSVFCPLNDLVPTNLLLVLVLAETRVQLFSFSALRSAMFRFLGGRYVMYGTFMYAPAQQQGKATRLNDN